MHAFVSATRPLPAPAARGWLTPLERGLLGAIWGASFLFMRVAAKDFGATPLVAVRLALGALILGGAVPNLPWVHEVGIFSLWAAAALTLVTGYDYLRLGIRHMD